jgi:hypothetical protein
MVIEEVERVRVVPVDLCNKRDAMFLALFRICAR